jgi:hypothetical protein
VSQVSDKLQWLWFVQTLSKHPRDKGAMLINEEIASKATSLSSLLQAE